MLKITADMVATDAIIYNLDRFYGGRRIFVTTIVLLGLSILGCSYTNDSADHLDHRALGVWQSHSHESPLIGKNFSQLAISEETFTWRLFVKDDRHETPDRWVLFGQVFGAVDWADGGLMPEPRSFFDEHLEEQALLVDNMELKFSLLNHQDIVKLSYRDEQGEWDQLLYRVKDGDGKE